MSTNNTWLPQDCQISST